MKPHDTLGPRHRLTARPVRHSPFALVLALIIAFGMPARAESPAPAAVIDDCQYSGDAAARAAWQPMRGTAAVATAMLDGRKVLRLPCDFTASNVERASWDRAVRLDLTSSRGIQFKVLCRNALPVSYFSIYFQSGEGWYHATFFPESSTAWNTIEIDKTEMKSEGKPAGWGEIKTIRVSAWRGKAVNTELYLSDIRKTDPLPPSGPGELAEAAISRIGKIASFNTYEEATNQVAASGNRNARVAKALVSAASLRESALKLAGQQQFTEATEQAAAAREQLVRAYCLAQKPLLDEFRGFWCHSAFGVQGMDWDEAIHRLADNGFTAILPNMLWGGAAFYESKVLPVAAQISTRGDQIRQCLAACRK